MDTILTWGCKVEPREVPKIWPISETGRAIKHPLKCIMLFASPIYSSYHIHIYFQFHDDQAGIPTMQILDRDQIYMFVRLDGLHTQDGMYNVSLTAKNHIKSSTPIRNKYHVVSTPPADTGTYLMKI